MGRSADNCSQHIWNWTSDVSTRCIQYMLNASSSITHVYSFIHSFVRCCASSFSFTVSAKRWRFIVHVWYSISKLTGIIVTFPPNLLNGRSLIGMISFSTFHLEMWRWFVSTHRVNPSSSITTAKLHSRKAFIRSVVTHISNASLIIIIIIIIVTLDRLWCGYVLRFECFTMKSNYTWSILGGFGFNFSDLWLFIVHTFIWFNLIFFNLSNVRLCCR